MGARVTRKRERSWVETGSLFKGVREEARPTTQLSPPGKKRKSNRGFSLSNTARTLFTTAAEAFMFVAVVGIATYQLWYGQQLEHLEEDQADSRIRRQARPPSSSDLSLPEASQRELPPPYEDVCNIRRESPSLSIQSLSRHSSPLARTIMPLNRTATTSCASRSFSSHPSSAASTSATTFSSPAPNPNSPMPADEIEQTEDALLYDMSDRLRALIQEGTDALQLKYSEEAITAGPYKSRKLRSRTLPRLQSPAPSLERRIGRHGTSTMISSSGI